MATLTKQEFTIIPADTIVEAEVVDVEEKETPFWVDEKDHSKGKSQQMSFRFKITDGEYAGMTVFGNTSCWFTENSKLGSWVREILAQDELPDELDTDNLIGLPVTLIIGNRTKEVNGQPVVSAHFVETIARLADDDMMSAEETF